ncbi:MAG TPA: hypothetical protein VFI42_15890, partial [Thermomicrobiaceae bacterium]|nr:hypothetical protein [Thermomicrobiaceae bacterium]
LLAHLPTEQFDRWLQPLPLSIVQQDRLDRMVAVLEQPLERGRALLVSGTLDTLERDALKEGRPEAYDAIYAQAVREMATAGPPLPAWADGVLGILFGRDAAHVFAEETTDADGKPKGGQFTGKPPVPTPAEQQDTIRHGKAG